MICCVSTLVPIEVGEECLNAKAQRHKDAELHKRKGIRI